MSIAFENDILLSQFRPVSELVTPVHETPLPKYPAIDFHIHCTNRRGPIDMEAVFERLKSAGVCGFVNLVGRDGEALDSTLEATATYRDRIATFAGVDFSRIDEPGFSAYVEKSMTESYDKGCRGMKVFKSLGLGVKDASGKYVRPDDKRLKCAWDMAAQQNIPVLIHIADPVAFFKPIDGKNERFEELNDHPNWAFSDPQFYTFMELMQMQQNMLRDNPDTTFVMTHVGCYPENLGYVSRLMDEFPNMYVDSAARLAELGRAPYSSRAFILKYQDRFMFSTDISATTDWLPNRYYYRYFETFDEYFPYDDDPGQGRFMIYGVGLPDSVLRKIYYQNACKLVPDLAKCLPEGTC